MIRKLFLLCLGVTLCFGCTHKHPHSLFSSLPSARSGIDFSNTIKEDDSTSSFIDEFGYMGGGVGIGDFNNDGLKDIFFTGNQVSCRLYINKGNNHFEDITEAAGLSTHVWATGVSIVDINGDGYDDIYVCVFGKNLLQPAKNLLFINQHNLTFKEEAEEYGLADMGYSTQAVFFDYDKDGDLDMYLTNYRLNGPNTNSVYPKDLGGHSPANDRLYRNDGDKKGLGHPFFTDVTEEANIRDCGYGLGVVASDLNGDGWPDVYVADDFVSDDLLWLNDRNGRFSDRLASATRHTSYSSMGVDAADLNNDGRPDIVTLDMLPEYNDRKKTSFSFMNYERYRLERSLGYQPQFMRNMLQLNDGNYVRGDTTIPFFSEIGELAGVSATDWSWSVLLADFDNDGWKDMHITNGIGRDFINADFLDFSNTVFSRVSTKEEQNRQIRNRLASLKHINLRNYLYLNNKDYTFSDRSAAAGIDIPSMSGGAAYADLDNDGDLDLVVNNIDGPAFLFINNTISPGQPPSDKRAGHFLRVDLQGGQGNRRGFGTKVWVYTGRTQQLQEQSPVRGYFSSVDQTLLFGLGQATGVDSVVVHWPDDRIQTLRGIRGDTLLRIDQRDAVAANRPPFPAALAGGGAGPTFTESSAETGILFRHKENIYNDFANQLLLPQKYSQLGPYIATADVNGDGLTDLFVGGAYNQPGMLFIQGADGRFTGRPLCDSIKWQEDEDALFFDADGDGDQDLLVTCGDPMYAANSPYYTPRLYLNDGKGHFSLAKDAISADVRTIAGCVCVGDLDGDGQPDLFIGGRVSKQYPLAPRSYILQNHHGRFTDVTATVCPEIAYAGMVTSAKWADLDRDGRADLVVAGEWMPVRLFRNEGGHLREQTEESGLGAFQGMWQSLAVADLDGDGDLDIVAGNLGLNCEYRAAPATPMELFATDLDGNGSIDPVFCYYIKDEDGVRRPYPAASRKKLADQIPYVKKRWLYNRDFARAGFADIYRARPSAGTKADSLLHLTCNETRSCYFENLGNGRWKMHPLPMEAQFTPVNAIVCEDIDRDGRIDLLLAGNQYQTEVMRGRYDAGYGCLLKGEGRDAAGQYQFGVVPYPLTGLKLDGDIRSMSIIHTDHQRDGQGGRQGKNDRLLLAAANDDSLRVFRINQ